MNPMHHPVTMTKSYGFLPRGFKGQAKHVFLQCHLWNVTTLDQYKYKGPVNRSPSGHQGLAADRSISALWRHTPNILIVNYRCHNIPSLNPIFIPLTSGPHVSRWISWIPWTWRTQKLFCHKCWINSDFFLLFYFKVTQSEVVCIPRQLVVLNWFSRYI